MIIQNKMSRDIQSSTEAQAFLIVQKLVSTSGLCIQKTSILQVSCYLESCLSFFHEKPSG